MRAPPCHHRRVPARRPAPRPCACRPVVATCTPCPAAAAACARRLVNTACAGSFVAGAVPHRPASAAHSYDCRLCSFAFPLGRVGVIDDCTCTWSSVTAFAALEAVQCSVPGVANTWPGTRRALAHWHGTGASTTRHTRAEHESDHAARCRSTPVARRVARRATASRRSSTAPPRPPSWTLSTASPPRAPPASRPCRTRRPTTPRRRRARTLPRATERPR